MVGEWMRHALSAALAVAIALVGTARAGGAERITTEFGARASVPQSPYVVSRSESDSLTGADRPDQNMVSARDPHDPVRIVVELAHQPLIPYLQQARTEHLAPAKSAARIGAAEVSSRLAKAIDSQRQVLEQAQAQLLGDMRREGWIKAEHWRFTGLLDAVSITTRYEHLSAIAKDPRVAAVHMDAKVQALLDTSVGVVGAPTVWSMLDGNGNAVTGQGITIAIIDTGIDYRHPDLGGCFGPDCKVVGGFDFVNHDDDPMDDNGHGTYVAGIAAANGTLRGVAPDARLLAYKALDANGAGSSSDIIAALERAVDPDGDPLTEDAADVINLSLGSFDDSNSPMSIAANRAMDAGSVVVAGAGNNGSGYGTLLSPGNAESVVTVGAVDNAGEIASFSSRGPVKEKDYVKPEIVAPGVGIRSTAPDGNYATFSGTSLATPHVAGGAALLMQLHPTLSPQEVKALLVNNARDVGEDVFTQGGGMLDLAAAATAQVVAVPALPSFGQTELDQALWQAQRPLTIRNISTQAWAGTFEQPSTLPPGVRIQTSPGDGINLAPGQSADVRLRLEADNQTLPFPDIPTLHHESTLALASETASMRIPWVLFKAALLDLDILGVPQDVVVFPDKKCKDPSGSYEVPCQRPLQDSDCVGWQKQNKSPVRVRVQPGVYHAWVAYSDPPGTCIVPRAFVFKDLDP